jgi:hypothetical protein
MAWRRIREQRRQRVLKALHLGSLVAVRSKRWLARVRKRVGGEEARRLQLACEGKEIQRQAEELRRRQEEESRRNDLERKLKDEESAAHETEMAALRAANASLNAEVDSLRRQVKEVAADADRRVDAASENVRVARLESDNLKRQLGLLNSQLKSKTDLSSEITNAGPSSEICFQAKAQRSSKEAPLPNVSLQTGGQAVLVPEPKPQLRSQAPVMSEAQRVAAEAQRMASSVVEETYSLIDQTSKKVVEDTWQTTEFIGVASRTVVEETTSLIDQTSSLIGQTSKKVAEDTRHTTEALMSLHQRLNQRSATAVDSALNDGALFIDNTSRSVVEETYSLIGQTSSWAQAQAQELGGTVQQAQAFGASFLQWGYSSTDDHVDNKGKPSVTSLPLLGGELEGQKMSRSHRLI